MSADFSTDLTATGTKEEYIRILEFFHHYADERQARYRSKRDCWYLDLWGNKIGEVTEDTLMKFVKNGVFSIGFSGPYGIIRGPIGEAIDLFERLADRVPTCWFKGEISGFDSYGDQELKAKLENGLLYLSSSLEDFEGDDDCDEDAEDEWDEDAEDEWDEDDEADEEDEEDVEWDTIYDPIKRIYLKRC